MPRRVPGWTVIATLAACGPGAKPVVEKPALPLPSDPRPELPAVPSRIEVVADAPMSDHTPAARSPLLDVMVAENQRWMAALGREATPAYHLAYQIVEQRVVSLDAEGGALVGDSDELDRTLDVEVRVGSPQLDNTRAIAGDGGELNEPLRRRAIVPFGADRQAVANHLWLETDRRYREAVLAMAYVQQDQRTLGKTSSVPDFSPAMAEVYIGPPAKLEFDKAAWVARLKRCSERALRGHATRGSCGVIFTENTAWVVTSEGTQLQQSWTTAQLAVSAGVKADDGDNLSRLEQAFGRGPADLPNDAEIDRLIDAVNRDIDALHKAPLAEPYVGPAILEGRAAGVFFHEVFGHRIEGHRQKDETGGQTFSSQVGKEIMPS